MRDLRATFELHVGGAAVNAHVADGALEAGEGPVPDADLTIDADLTLRALMTGEMSAATARASDGIRLTGDAALLDRFAEIFRSEQFPDPPVSRQA